MPIYVGGVDVEATTKNKLDKEIEERKAEDTKLENKITDEATARETADGNLDTLITPKADNLTNAINSLYETRVTEPLGIQIINFLYPIGAIYITMGADDPNTMWQGTTWEKIKSGLFLEATDGTTKEAGKETEAGLPNIWGQFGVKGYETTASGCFTRQQWNMNASGATNTGWLFTMDASRSSAVYGKSSTVQPNSIAVFMWKRTA